MDYIEIINNSEPMHQVNAPAIRWWEELVLRGISVSACAGMDLHKVTDCMAGKFATYAEGEVGGDCIAELRTALAKQRTWVSKGMLADWHVRGEHVVFELCDVGKPGFIPADTYTLTLTGRGGIRTFDLTEGGLSIPLSHLSDVEIPKLYGGKIELENLVCVAPVIRKA